MALVRLIDLAPVAVVLLIFCCCSSINPGVAVDTLRQGGPALPPGSNSSLDSPSGQFSLAITEFNSDNLTCRYLGLWWEFRYFIWTADASFRICDGSGRLVLDSNGTLKLTHSAAPPLVLYSNTTTTSKNLTAAVQDNGSLAVRDGNDPVWQSFDSPTDSWLPGMKLGVVNTGLQNRKLTSWLVDSLPVKGAFTLEWDPKREELVMKRRAALYWASGKQLGPDRFQHLDLTGISSAGLDYNVTRVSKDGDDYLTFGVSVNGNSVPGQWNFSILALGHDGGIEDKTVGVPALDPDLCDGNSTENGCVRWGGPECRSSNEERFYLPRWDEMLEEWDEVDGAANGSVVAGSISDCKEWCWNHCQCGGVSLQRAGNGTTQCVFYKYGVSSNESSGVPRANMYRQIKGQVARKYDSGGDGSTNAPSISPSAAPSAVDPPATAKVKNSSIGKWVKKSGKWVLVGTALAFMILLILGTVWYTRKRKLRGF